MEFIDTHAHLYLEEFDADRPAAIHGAGTKGVSKIFMPAVDSFTHDAMLALEAQFPEICYAMMGLHPCSVKADPSAELKIVEDHLTSRDFLAVGKPGSTFIGI